MAFSEAQAGYLVSVLRLGVGASVHLFNGRDGEWRAELNDAAKRRAGAICVEATMPQGAPPDLWLLFAPVRKERTAFIVEKAVELGVARLLPVSTRRVNAERLRIDREQAHAMEAAEQCEATWVPEVAPLQPLERLLADWPAGRRLYWADEEQAQVRAGTGTASDWPGSAGEPAAILIGPEGGFAPEERARLIGLPFVTPMALGPRILRAETAALAAITLWQARFGDWVAAE